MEITITGRLEGQEGTISLKSKIYCLAFAAALVCVCVSAVDVYLDVAVPRVVQNLLDYP